MKFHLFTRAANSRQATGPSADTRQARSTRSKLLLTAAATSAVAATLLGATSASANIGVPRQPEHFHIMSVSAASGKSAIIATGAFTAGGVVTGDFTSGGTLTVTLPGGSFKITARRMLGSGSFSIKTCLTTSGASGTYRIHGGTGRYTNITGSGKFAYGYLSVYAHAHGHCGRTIAAESTISLRGSVKI